MHDRYRREAAEREARHSTDLSALVQAGEVAQREHAQALEALRAEHARSMKEAKQRMDGDVVAAWEETARAHREALDAHHESAEERLRALQSELDAARLENEALRTKRATRGSGRGRSSRARTDRRSESDRSRRRDADHTYLSTSGSDASALTSPTLSPAPTASAGPTSSGGSLRLGNVAYALDEGGARARRPSRLSPRRARPPPSSSDALGGRRRRRGGEPSEARRTRDGSTVRAGGLAARARRHIAGTGERLAPSTSGSTSTLSD
jgi:hypothetical protein